MTVTSTALRTRGMRDSARRALMAALLQRGGSMPHDEFHRLLAGLYTTDRSISAAKAKMQSLGLIERRIFLTAKGRAALLTP